jgi:hypothetical protein
MYPETFERIMTGRCSTPSRPYRLRLNRRTNKYAIEQKVSRAIEIPAEGDDFVTARVRDGYGLVMEFSASPYKVCPQCHLKIDLPVMQIAEVRCSYCNDESRASGTDNNIWFEGYYPLCDKLIEALERTAPKRGAAWVAEMEARNERLARTKKQDFRNYSSAVAGDYWNQVAGNTVIGYGSGPASHGRL